MSSSDLAQFEFLEADAWAHRLDALDGAAKQSLGSRVRRFGRAVALATPGADVAVVNRAFALGWEAPLDADLLADVNGFYRDAGAPRWLVELSPHATVIGGRETLTRQGGVQKTPTVKLCGSLRDATPADGRQLPAVGEIDQDSAEVFCEIVGSAFGLPRVVEPDLVSTLGHPDWHYYMAFSDGRPIAGAAMFVQNDGAWFGVAATSADARGRGAQTALLTRRLADAKRLGCSWVTAETAPDTAEQPNQSYRNMLRLGLRVAYLREKYLFVNTPSLIAPES
jgi:GNAT superfamily N-acetyltransferase